MPISRTQQFAPVILPAGRLTTALRAAYEAVGVQPNQANVTERLPDESQSETLLDLAALDRYCNLTDKDLSIRTTGGPSGPQTWHYLSVAGGQPGRVHVQTPDGARTETMIGAFMAASGLELYIPPSAEPEPEIELDETPPTDTTESPQPLAPETRRLRAFQSYRFGPGNEPTARQLARLMTLLDVEVITGHGYEPRPLNVKVADRLVGVDLLVLIVGADGESAWTRDEIATARAAGIPVIPLVASGAHFEEGLFGDLEYITFDPEHPGDAAIPLIEGIQYVRRTATRR